MHALYQDVGGLSFDEMHEEFRLVLLNPMQLCCDQLKHRNLDGTPLYKSLSQIIDLQRNGFQLVKYAPLFITEALHIIYGQPAIVLIDEYEAPLNRAIEHKYLSPASNFFGKVFSLLLKVGKFL
jgi:hypothetical protein